MVHEVTIKKLSNEVKSKLRSGIAITSITQCVEELVLNAIDGEATCIAVRVDLNIFRIQVVDNGSGISEEDLKIIGDRYATSKCHTLEDLNKNLSFYGFRGEALASIIQLGGVIEITSKHKNSERTFSKLFTYGQNKGVIICDTKNRPSIGTTVTIQDFMHNMPVRRKVMKESIDLENIRMRMECIALIHPMISISIRNDANNKTILFTKKAKSSLDTFTQIFGTAHLSNMAETFHSFDKFTISGYMSTQPYHSKALQFVYVNKRYTTQTKIHSFINELFNRTSIIRSKIQCIVPPNHADKIACSPPKGIRYFGIFLLNIECPLSEYDICLDPKKTLVEFKEWHSLFVCIEEMMLKFAKEEGLLISLDDRFRKSEKETLDSYSESPMPHSSSSLLQAFSNAKGNIFKDNANCISNKITATDEISIKNIKAAIHSFPANREKVNPVTNKERELKICCSLTTELHSKYSDGKKFKTITTNHNVSELNKINDPIIDSNLLTKPTIVSNEVPSNSLTSETLPKNKVSVLEIANQSNCQKNSSISALKRLSTVNLSYGDQLTTNNSKLTKDSIYHLSSIQELKYIYQKKLNENSSTPANCFKPIISSPDPTKAKLSRYDDTKDSIDLYYSKKGNVSKTKVSHNGLSGTLSQKFTQKKKEKLIQNTLNSFKFKKNFSKTGIFIKSKKKVEHINVLDHPVNSSIYDSHFNFDPVSSSDIKNNEISVPLPSKVNDNKIDFSDSPDFLSNHNSINNVLSESENFMLRKTGNKKNVISQFCLENSYKPIDTLNGEETHQMNEKLINPAYLLSERGNGIDFENNNSSFIPTNSSTNAQNKVTQNIAIKPHNYVQKTVKTTHKDDFTLMSEPSQISEIVLNANDFNKNFEDVAFDLPNPLFIDNNINRQMLAPLTVDEPCIVNDAAKQNCISDCVIVIPIERCSVTNSIEQLSCQSSSARLSDNSNLQLNSMNVYINQGNESTEIYLRSNEETYNNYCNNLFMDLSIEDDALDKQRDKIYNCADMSVSNILNGATQKYIPPCSDEIISNCNVKVNKGNISARSRSPKPTMSVNVAVQSQLQIADLDKNFDGEQVIAETPEIITNLNNSIFPKIDLPYFYVPTTTLNKNDQLSELNNFNSKNTDINLDSNGNKKTEYLLLNEFLEFPYKDCDNSESETSSSKMIIKDFVINTEDNNFLPMKRKFESNKYSCHKFVKLVNVPFTQYENSSSQDNPSSIKMDNCLNFNETELSNCENHDFFISDSLEFDLSKTRNKNSSDQLLYQVEATSKMPSCIFSKKIEFSEVIAQKPSLEFSDVVGFNKVTKLCNANQALNSTDHSVPLDNSIDNLTRCSYDLIGQVTDNLMSPQCSSSELQASACIDLYSGITENITTDETGSLIIKPSSVNERSELQPVNCVEDFQSGSLIIKPSSVNERSELQPVSCVEDFQSPYMELALDSFLNEHFDLHYICNEDNNDNSHFNIGKLWNEWSVPKIAMNSEVLSSHCEDRERFSSIKSYSLVHPYKFKGEMLQSCKVLGQVDKKFIAITFTCNSMLVKNSVPSKHFNLIALVDQHAADERVQLEKVLALSYDENTLQLKRKHLTNPFEINFRPEEVRMMKAYRGAFKDLGLEFTMVNNEVVLFHTLPYCLVAQERNDKYTRRCQTATKVIEATVKEMCENIRLIGGTSETLSSRPLPKPLQHVYNTIACRSAIKFGDELSIERCIKLIQMLSKCKLPFQCAHGRPSIIPVVDLNYLQAKSKEFEPKPRLNLKKLIASKLR